MPATLEALIILFVFAVPAYLTIAVYKARNPVQYYREQSAIEQAALYIFLGITVNICAIFFIWSLWLFVTFIQNSLSVGATLAPHILSDSIGGLFTITFLLIIAYFATGTTFSFLVGDVLGRLLPAEEPLWVQEIKKLKVKQAKAETPAPWVLVHLKNGDRCLGLVSETRWRGDKDNTIELALAKTFYQVAKTERREDVGRVLLRSEDILWLSLYLLD